MCTIAVLLARTQAGYVAMPNVAIALGKVDPLRLGFAIAGEQAKRHSCRICREYREIHAITIKGGAKGRGAPTTDRMPRVHAVFSISLKSAA
jgi:hypothetical protein